MYLLRCHGDVDILKIDLETIDDFPSAVLQQFRFAHTPPFRAAWEGNIGWDVAIFRLHGNSDLLTSLRFLGAQRYLDVFKFLWQINVIIDLAKDRCQMYDICLVRHSNNESIFVFFVVRSLKINEFYIHQFITLIGPDEELDGLKRYIPYHCVGIRVAI